MFKTTKLKPIKQGFLIKTIEVWWDRDLLERSIRLNILKNLHPIRKTLKKDFQNYSLQSCSERAAHQMDTVFISPSLQSTY